MKRILLMILRNLFYVPYGWIKLNWYAAHKDRYSKEQILALLLQIDRRAIRGGNVELEVHGRENLPEEDGFILYPNHQGLFDVLAVMDAFARPLAVVAKKELTNIPLLKQVFALTGSYMIDREDLRQSLTVIQNVTKDVKAGINFLIFPEGTRSKKQNGMLEFKGGSFKAAQKTRCPVVPVAIMDSYKVFDTNSISKVKVKIWFLPPILFESYQGMNTNEIAAMTQEQIRKVIEENENKE